MDQVHKRMNETSTVLFSEQLSKMSSHQQNVMEVHFWQADFLRHRLFGKKYLRLHQRHPVWSQWILNLKVAWPGKKAVFLTQCLLKNPEAASTPIFSEMKMRGISLLTQSLGFCWWSQIFLTFF